MMGSQLIVLFLVSVLFQHLLLCARVSKRTGGGNGEDNKYRYSTPLDPDGIFHLFWDVDYATSTVNFRLRAHVAKSRGWFGVGFSDYGDIQNADMAVFWTDPDGWHHLQLCRLATLHSETHISGDVRKKLLLCTEASSQGSKRARHLDADGWTDRDGYFYTDTQQDFNLTSSRISDHVTTLSFSRKFDTCDDHDYVFDNGTTHVVYFVAGGRPGGVTGTRLTQYRHGLTRVQLLKPDLPDVTPPSDVWTFDVTAPQVRVPSAETTYWWYVTRLPKLKHKHHIIKYSALIAPGREGLVHHMELFHCQTDERTRVPLYNGPGQAEEKPAQLAACRHVLGAWAMGAEAMVYPEEAGVPIGGDHFSAYVLLEIHYNNPTHKTGVVDSSGLRFHVTRKLRAHDAGIMELGLEYTDKMAIPPGQDRFTLTGYCLHQCTERGLPPSGITVFASQLHTHLTGKRVRTRHVRYGVELPELNRDDHYSPHYQEIRRLQYPTRVLPGDALITSCDDSTLDRNNVTTGGLSIHQEMCLNYVHYFPRVELEVCKSSVADAALSAFFTFLRVMEGQPTSKTEDPTQNFASVTWNPLNVHLLTSLYDDASLSMQCNQSDGRRFPGQWEGVPKTHVQVPLEKAPRPCPGHEADTPRSAVEERSRRGSLSPSV